MTSHTWICESFFHYPHIHYSEYIPHWPQNNIKQMSPTWVQGKKSHRFSKQEIKNRYSPLSIIAEVKLTQVTEGRANLKNLGGRLEKSWLKPPSCRKIQPFCCLLKSVFIRYNGISMHSVNQSLRKDLTEVKRVSEGFLRTAVWETDSRSSWMVLPSDYKMREAYKGKTYKIP